MNFGLILDQIILSIDSKFVKLETQKLNVRSTTKTVFRILKIYFFFKEPGGFSDTLYSLL